MVTRDPLNFLRGVAADLRFVEQSTLPDCSEDELRIVSGKLRHLLDDGAKRLVRAWALTQIGGRTMVSAFDVNRKVMLDGIGYSGGAEDAPQTSHQEAFGVPEAFIANAKNIGLDWIHVGENAPDSTMSDEFAPFVRTDFTLHRFPNSYCLFVDRAKVTRRQVVAYVANVLGGVHDGSVDTASKRDKNAFCLLEQLARQTVKNRGAEFYALMSIGQDLTRAPDIQTLMRVAEEQPRSEGRR